MQPFINLKKQKNSPKNRDCVLLFLPPYSPDLNPIETFWANLKAKIRSIIKKFLTLSMAINYAFNL
jgi:transposase